MSHSILRTMGVLLSLSIFAGCAQAPKEPPGPPPPQNLLGTTDELQLVTELSVNLAAQYGGEHILVVLEIDNTLLTSDQGGYTNPCRPVKAGEEPLSSAMRPTQNDAAQQVRRIQEAGMKAIVVTSRAPDCRNQTFEDLRSNDLNFAASAWRPASGNPEQFLPNGADRPVVYEEGVFFTDGQNKGQMLKAFLEKTGDPKPVLIVMADSSKEDLNAVMKIFSWTDTKVHAWRYTREQSIAVASGP
ncbi:MAG: DUF2608 domain-containing protein [Xanthomonadales bacterium]|nr:DUF2608 domain-containing protein [Gammaproteobacteria bacterium]MBT8054032.1 DUF2608 domain-containing protein [Gammaproteobacteria bacterium]NND57083.1 DUF2608 domain-containing protein [Xanthomonadales bacterium]NNK51027.1 DUF2608 domain-containing protein [Xanthomonadales bacterium]